jgi:hypothetical protein
VLSVLTLKDAPLDPEKHRIVAVTRRDQGPHFREILPVLALSRSMCKAEAVFAKLTMSAFAAAECTGKEILRQAHSTTLRAHVERQLFRILASPKLFFNCRSSPRGTRSLSEAKLGWCRQKSYHPPSQA